MKYEERGSSYTLLSTRSVYNEGQDKLFVRKAGTSAENKHHNLADYVCSCIFSARVKLCETFVGCLPWNIGTDSLLFLLFFALVLIALLPT